MHSYGAAARVHRVRMRSGADVWMVTVFGHGVHPCIGVPLARMEAEISLDDGMLTRSACCP